jgi:hypothetical protein
MCLGYRHLWRLGRTVGLAGVSMNIPAFPIQDAYSMSTEQGMTLRDYFAAKAMQAMIAHPDSDDNKPAFVFAEAAYIMANAMLKAREQ